MIVRFMLMQSKDKMMSCSLLRFYQVAFRPRVSMWTKLE